MDTFHIGEDLPTGSLDNQGPENNAEPNPEIEAQVNKAREKASNKPTCLIVLGMAGSGKTTFVQKLAEHLYDNEEPGYLINLDPACQNLPFPANVDIRDTINYKKVMKDYGLGPNGAIITALNLYSTKFDQLIELLERRSGDYKHFIMDTPGQIEIFNWSASGMVITETLSSQMPTAIVYVIDTVRNINPATFMSNMLYACSILYKTKLPLILVLNKTDLQNEQFIIDWMKDFDVFLTDLEKDKEYVATLTRSLALVLDEFYSGLKTVGVSSVTGLGMESFLEAVEEARKEYIEIHLRERIEMNQSTRVITADLLNLNIKGEAIPEEDEDDLEAAGDE